MQQWHDAVFHCARTVTQIHWLGHSHKPGFRSRRQREYLHDVREKAFGELHNAVRLKAIG